ncbi:MAG TPA: hypothetical protein VGU74_01540 [Gemmatimonadales bacterium]|nr:hypothetical protein [Gemmatimonadales bacterium]
MNIRFSVISVSILLAVATRSPAQQAVIGLSGGGTYSDFSNPDTPSRWGFTGGLFAGVAKYGSLSLLEVSYTQKGGKGARIDYVETGITAGGFAKSGSGRARAYGGITVAFPVSCDATDAPRTAFCDNTNTEWAVPVGIMLGKGKPTGGFVGLDVRYSIPLTDASRGTYNNTWMFRLMIGRPKG